jgi:citrate lyase beta subunit
VRFNHVRRSSAAHFLSRAKWGAWLLFIFCLGSGAFAADFRTLDGTQYKGVMVKRVEADGIVVMSDIGVEKVYFTELPTEVRERYRQQAAAAAASGAAAEPATSSETVSTTSIPGQEYGKTAAATRSTSSGQAAAASTVRSVAAPIVQPTATPAQAAPPMHTYELKQDYVIGGDTGTVVKRLSKGQRYRGRDVPDGIQLEIDGKMYTLPRDILSPAKD